MEVPGGVNNKGKVFIYEFFGTSVLVYAVLASGGNMVAVSATVLALIVGAGPITGAHFNPAVSIGVYFYRRKWCQDLPMFMMVLLAEFTGAFLGVFWAWLVLMPSYMLQTNMSDKSIPVEWLVPLCPVGVDDYG